MPAELVFAGVFVLWLIGCWLFEEPTDQPIEPKPKPEAPIEPIPGWDGMTHEQKYRALNDYWKED